MDEVYKNPNPWYKKEKRDLLFSKISEVMASAHKCSEKIVENLPKYMDLSNHKLICDLINEGRYQIPESNQQATKKDIHDLIGYPDLSAYPEGRQIKLSSIENITNKIAEMRSSQLSLESSLAKLMLFNAALLIIVITLVIFK
ncbi:hypothetical protein D9M71_717890 [compost metagenome]